MKLQTDLDEILLGATMGALPLDAEVSRVIPPPGTDPSDFVADVWSWVADVKDLHGQGRLKPARDMAEALGRAYVAAFDTTVKPRQAGTDLTVSGPNFDAMSPREVADYFRADNQTARR